MASLETAANGDHARPNSLSLMTNGDSSGPESFAVIDSCHQDELQMERSFALDSIGTIDLDDLVTKVRGLQDENLQLKDLMEQSQQKSDLITTRVRKLYKERTQLEDEIDHLKEVGQASRTQTEKLEKELILSTEKYEKELASTTEKYEKQLAFSTQSCAELRQEFQLMSAAVDLEGESRLREENENLRRHNEELKLELKTARSDVDNLLKDMNNSQEIKSNIQTELLAEKKTVEAQRLELAKVKRISEKIIVEKQEVINMNAKLQSELEKTQRALREFENTPISMSSTNFPDLSLSPSHATSGFDHVTASEVDGSDRDGVVEQTRVKSRFTDSTDEPSATTDGDSEYETGDEAEGDLDEGETTAPVDGSDAPLGPDDDAAAQPQATQERGVEKKDDPDNTGDQNEGPTEAFEENRAVAGLSTGDATAPATVRSPVIARLPPDEDSRNPLSVAHDPQTVDGPCGPVMNSMKSTCYRQTAQSKLDDIKHHLQYPVTAEDWQCMVEKLKQLILETRQIIDRETDQFLAVTEENQKLKSESEHVRQVQVDLETEVHKLKVDLGLERVQPRLSGGASTAVCRENVTSDVASDERRQSESSVGGDKESSSSVVVRLEKRCFSLERENSTLKGIRTSHQAMSDATKEHISMSQAENDKLRKEVERISAEAADWKTKLLRENKETQHLESIIDDLRESKEELEDEIKTLSEQFETLTADSDKKQRELNAIKGQSDSLCDEYHRRNVSNEELLNQIAQKEVECQEFKNDIRTLHAENERLNELVNEMTEKVECSIAERDVFRHDYEDERRAREAIKGQKDDLSLQLHRFQGELITDRHNLQHRYPSTHADQAPYAPVGGHGNQPPHAPGGAHHANGGQNPYPYPPNAGYPQQGQGHGQPDLECPICFERFTDIHMLTRHASACKL